MQLIRLVLFGFLILITAQYVNAQCNTSAGTMSTTQTIHLCIDECTENLSHNGDEVLDPGHIFEFIIHDGSTPVNIIARNHSPTFCFYNLVGVSSGTTYYISAVAGPPNAQNHVDENHPCYSQSPGTPVIWYQYPVASVSTPNQNVCGSSFTINAATPQPGYTGTWTSTGDFVPTGGTTFNSPNINVLVSNYEEMTFTWTVSDGVCSSSDNVTLNFLQIPTAYAGENFAICGNEATLAASYSLPNTAGQWSGPGTFSPMTSPTATVTVNNYGPHTFTWRESNENCWTEDNVTITFVQEPNPVITKDFDTVCGNNYNLVATNVNFSGVWTALENGNPVIPNPIANSNNPVTNANIGSYPGLSRTIEYIWTETNQAAGQTCVASASIMVTYSKEPNASVGPITHYEVCGNTYTFNADTTGSGWATGNWSAHNVIAEFDNPNLPNAFVTIDSLGSFGDSAYVEVPFVWAMKNVGCTSLDTMWVTFYRKPKAFAGLDNAVCGNNYQLGAVFSIPETPNYDPYGQWFVQHRPVPEASANIVPTQNDTVNVSVSHYGQWVFRFRENNANLSSCFSTDTVRIEFVEVPVVDAGEDQHVCGTTTQLEATSSTGFSGSWLPNGAQFIDSSDPNTQVSVSTYGWLDFIWMESNQAETDPTFFCSARDTVSIRFWRVPSAEILTDLEDSTACGRKFNHLRAKLPPTGMTGTWICATDPDPEYGNVNSNNTWVEVSHLGYHEFYWIESNGPSFLPGFCTDTAGPLLIHFIEKPVANAGGDTLFCGLTGNLNAIPSVGTGVWSTPSTENIVFNNLNSPITQVNSNVYTGSTANPFFILIWTEDNTNECTDKDTIKVEFARIPSSDINIIPPKCYGEAAILSATETELPEYEWSFQGAIVDSVTINQHGGDFEYLVRWPLGDTAHRITLFVTNQWGCTSPIAIDTVFEPKIPDFGVTVYGDTCLLGKGAIVFLDTLGQNAFYWMNPDIGPPPGQPITAVYNLPEGEYDIRARYRTLNTQWASIYITVFGNDRCTDTVTYEVEPIGILHAEFEVPPDILMEELVAPEAEVLFINRSDYGGVSRRCIWHFGDGNTLTSCDEQVYHTYTKAGCFEPFLIIMNRDLQQCRDTAFIDFCIEVDQESNLEIPNVFTPDGDGINDYFQVKARTLRDFRGYIVNRWGEVIYEWTNWQDEDAGWDGRMKGGGNASSGVYFYIIKAIGMDDVEYDEHGFLHLIR